MYRNTVFFYKVSDYFKPEYFSEFYWTCKNVSHLKIECIIDH